MRQPDRCACTTACHIGHPLERTETMPAAALTLSTCKTAMLALLACLLLAALPAQAEIFYKWQGENGVWEYGAHPPPGVDAIEIKTTSTKAATAAKAADSSAANATTGGGTLEVETVEKRARKQKHAEYCATASANLEALSSKAVIRRRDAEGNINTITEKERKEEMEKAQIAIERYCG